MFRFLIPLHLLVQGWGMVRVENPKLGPGPLIDQLAPWENFQVLGPHSGVEICENNSIKRSEQLHGPGMSTQVASCSRVSSFEILGSQYSAKICQ